MSGNDMVGMSPEFDRQFTRAAVELIQRMWNDCVVIVRDVNRSPDARLAAMALAQNILTWDAGTDTVQMSDSDQKLVTNPLNLTM